MAQAQALAAQEQLEQARERELGVLAEERRALRAVSQEAREELQAM